MSERKTYRWVLAALLIAAAAVRLFAALCFRQSDSPGYGLATLMVRHMSEGRGWPLFYYGNTCTGSLEPLLGAFLCRLFGFSTFLVCLPTALMGFLLVPVVYLWGRDAGGRKAGLMAAALCIVGPKGFYEHLARPEGGYGVIILFGAALVWLASRLAAGELANESPRAWLYGLFGLIAGVGWWTDSLIIGAILAAGIVLCIGLRGRVFSARSVFLIGGFLVGSLPWSIWNARHGWASVTCLDLLATTPSEWLGILVAGGTAAVIVRRTPSPRAVFLLAAVLFVIVSETRLLDTGYTTFHTWRYLSALVPAFSVLVGAGIAALTPRLPLGMGWLPFVLLLGIQADQIKFSLQTRASANSRTVLARSVSDFLATNGVDVAFGEQHLQWLNSATAERLTVVDAAAERYAPYGIAGETARHTAFLADSNGVESLIVGSGGACRRAQVLGLPILFDIRRNEAGLVPIAAELWKGASDADGHDWFSEVPDGDLRTAFRDDMARDAQPWIDIQFKQPVTVAAVRWIGGAAERSLSWQVEGRRGDDQAWQTLTPAIPENGWFWSGPRLFRRGVGSRAECRFAPVSVTQLRVRFINGETAQAIRVSEVYVFGPGPEMATEEEALKDLLSLLNAHGISRLYSDRWVANEIAAATAGRIATIREPSVFEREITQPPQPPHRGSVRMELNRGVAFLARTEDAPDCRRSLSACGVETRETAVGPWVLFDIPEDRWQPRYACEIRLYWTGFNCLIGKIGRPEGRQIIQSAGSILKAGNADGPAQGLLEAVQRELPDYWPAVRSLAALYRQQGDSEKARRIETRFEQLTTPPVQARIRFSGGFEFLGLSFDRAAYHPGDVVTVKSYWRCPATSNQGFPVVFIHFTQGKRRFFQDDFGLLYDKAADILCQSDRDVSVEERTVKIPVETPPGVYEIRLGLTDFETGKRWRPRTDLKQAQRAAILPCKLTVEGPR